MDVTIDTALRIAYVVGYGEVGLLLPPANTSIVKLRLDDDKIQAALDATKAQR